MPITWDEMTFISCPPPKEKEQHMQVSVSQAEKVISYSGTQFICINWDGKITENSFHTNWRFMYSKLTALFILGLP